MKELLILVSLFVSSTPQAGVAVRESWTPNQLAATQKVCVMSALQANPKATSAQASYFCKCALDEASTKWAYADFTNNEEQYTQQLGNEGTIARCARTAFQINPVSLNKFDPGASQINPGLHKVDPRLYQMRLMLEPLGQTLLNKPGVTVKN